MFTKILLKFEADLRLQVSTGMTTVILAGDYE
jgi:hypothetical protein